MASSQNLRIISLLPAATEMVCLLGLQDLLVGISHDSDYPRSITRLPKITTTVIDQSLPSREIDKKIRESNHRGQSVFHIDKKQLAELAPNLILTQELCPVCAPSFSSVEKAAKLISSSATIISLEPHFIEDMFQNIKTIAKHTDSVKQAEKAISKLRKRLGSISNKLQYITTEPSVLIIEWLDPLMIAGHWVPEMVKKAGGMMPLAKPGEKSRKVSWEEILHIDPDIIIFAPCGFDIKRAFREADLITKRKGFTDLKAYKAGNIFFVDGNSYFTRPGPRIIDGIEILSEILYPSIFHRTHSIQSWRPLT